MAQRKKRDRNQATERLAEQINQSGSSAVVIEGTDGVPEVHIIQEEVAAVISVQVIEAGGLVFGSGDFRVRDPHQGKEVEIGVAIEPHVKAMMQVVADILGARVASMDDSGIKRESFTTMSRSGGRA